MAGVGDECLLGGEPQSGCVGQHLLCLRGERWRLGLVDKLMTAHWYCRQRQYACKQLALTSTEIFHPDLRLIFIQR